MDATQYENFEPKVEILPEEDCETIHLHAPDFKRENLRVQLTPNRILRISGQREIEKNKMIRFQKEFLIAPNHDTNRITAKFEKGILYVRQVKLLTPEDKQDKKSPVPEPATPQKPADEPQPQKNVQQSSAENTSPRDSSAKPTNVPDFPQKKPEEQSKTTNEKGTESRSSSSLKKKFEEENSGSLDESKKQTSFTSDKRENDATKAADKMDKGTTENVDGSGEKRRENYKGAAVDMAAKLKMSRRIVNVVLVVLLAVVLGLYVTNFIRSYREAEN